MPARLNAVRKTGRMVSRRLMRRNSTAAMRFADAFSRFPALAGLIGTAIAVSMAALSFAALWQGRAQALQNANQAAANLVATLSADIARNIDSAASETKTVNGALTLVTAAFDEVAAGSDGVFDSIAKLESNVKVLKTESAKFLQRVRSA